MRGPLLYTLLASIAMLAMASSTSSPWIVFDDQPESLQEVSTEMNRRLRQPNYLQECTKVLQSGGFEKIADGSYGTVFASEVSPHVVIKAELLGANESQRLVGCFSDSCQTKVIDVPPEVGVSVLLDSLENPAFVQTSGFMICNATDNVLNAITNANEKERASTLYRDSLFWATLYRAQEKVDGVTLSEKILKHKYLNYLFYTTDKKGLPNLDFFRSVFIQILTALREAQSSIEFCHQDLHTSNVMLQKLEKDNSKTWEFGDGAKMTFEVPSIATHGAIARIIDYGLARAKDSYGGIVYPTEDETRRDFNPHLDVSSFTISLIATIGKEGLESMSEQVEPHEWQSFSDVLQKSIDWDNMSEELKDSLLQTPVNRFRKLWRTNSQRDWLKSFSSSAAASQESFQATFSLVHEYMQRYNNVKRDVIGEILSMPFFDKFRL